MSEQQKKTFKQKYINQIIRITTKNKRIFEGTLKAIDFRSNLIIHNAVAEIPADQNCPLNAEINSIYDMKLVYTPDPKLTEQQQKKAKDQYMASHYFIGAIMISGEDIVKAQLRNPPIVNKPKQEKKAEENSTKA